MEHALFISSSTASKIAAKVVNNASVRSVSINKHFAKGEFLGYYILVSFHHSCRRLTESDLNNISNLTF